MLSLMEEGMEGAVRETLSGLKRLIASSRALLIRFSSKDSLSG